MNSEKLKGKKLEDLKVIAKEMGISKVSSYKKAELIEAILNFAEDQKKEEKRAFEKEVKRLPDKIGEELQGTGKVNKAEGILDLHAEGYGFLRCNNYLSSDADIYVSSTQIKKFNLKKGDKVFGIIRPPKQSERFDALLYVEKINGEHPSRATRRPNFEDLIPIYPDDRFHLETERHDLANRIIDLMAPIGRGQRGMIVAPPKAGKTILLKRIASSIEKNYPEVEVIVLLIDERPEEVTDMQRSVKGDVVASTFDEEPRHHAKVAEMVLERAKRLVEHGKDVVILLDSITRLARAYNLVVSPSGRTLSGGLDPGSLHKPKRFFGAARNVEGGGSLTILGTALVETGSRMDDVIFEEFKGTGNMEVKLSRKLSERRIFPAIEILSSGTRKEDLLLSNDELEAVLKIRRSYGSMDTVEASEALLERFKKTSDNAEFVGLILGKKTKK
ncbi:MAG: transcription termination factor Rho [Tissierellales bacterium]|jgi:transcription termination factor Rho|nr:transcription termination factor Rho [Tissierellales bacterium]